MFNVNITEQLRVQSHGICGTDLGRLIKMATYNIHSIGVVKPVYGIRTFQLTAKAV